MKTLLFLISILVIISCTTKTGTKTSSENTKNNNIVIGTKISYDTNVALKFINDYTNIINDEAFDETWIEENKLVTDNFKKAYKNLLDSANKADPEMGLEFDPIFDAQDYPDKGFEIMKFDNLGYVTVKGRDWPDFKVVIKMIYHDSKSLVDGCGVINIPVDKRAKR